MTSSFQLTDRRRSMIDTCQQALRVQKLNGTCFWFDLGDTGDSQNSFAGLRAQSGRCNSISLLEAELHVFKLQPEKNVPSFRYLHEVSKWLSSSLMTYFQCRNSNFYQQKSNGEHTKFNISSAPNYESETQLIEVSHNLRSGIQISSDCLIITPFSDLRFKFIKLWPKTLLQIL